MTGLVLFVITLFFITMSAVNYKNPTASLTMAGIALVFTVTYFLRMGGVL